MAAELERAFGTEAKLFAEGKGIFDVVVDGKLVFSKYETRRFPALNEVTALLQRE